MKTKHKFYYVKKYKNKIMSTIWILKKIKQKYYVVIKSKLI